MIAFLLGNWRLVLMALLLAAIGIQTLRLDWCQKGRAEDRARITVLGAQIAEQNRAVEELERQGAAKATEAAKALRKAETRARTWDANAARLRAILTARKPEEAKSCSDAWARILRL